MNTTQVQLNVDIKYIENQFEEISKKGMDVHGIETELLKALTNVVYKLYVDNFWEKDKNNFTIDRLFKPFIEFNEDNYHVDIVHSMLHHERNVSSKYWHRLPKQCCYKNIEFCFNYCLLPDGYCSESYKKPPIVQKIYDLISEMYWDVDIDRYGWAIGYIEQQHLPLMYHRIMQQLNEDYNYTTTYILK